MAKEDIVKHQFTSEQSRTEAANNGRKGGIASGKARRDKRTWKAIADDIASRIMADKNGNPVISPITGEKMSIREGISTKLFQEAMKGNMKAIQYLLDISGEKQFRQQTDLTTDGKPLQQAIRIEVIDKAEDVKPDDTDD